MAIMLLQASELGYGVLFAALLMSDEMARDRISLPSNDIENAIPHALNQSQLLLQVSTIPLEQSMFRRCMFHGIAEWGCR